MDTDQDGFPLTSIREINTIIQCKHENIVNIIAVVVGSSSDNIFIAMEYLDHDLKTLMEDIKKPFTEAVVKCLLIQLLSGMEYLHDNWILHRDIKPSNLLLNNVGKLKIADFGLARKYGDPLKPYTKGVVTLWYRSPELLLGAVEYTSAIDMWSIGTVFAELLLKETLFRGEGEMDQLEKTFKILGSIDTDIWPGFTSLPFSKRFKVTKYVDNNIKSKFPRLSEQGIHLLNSFLTYNPEMRISAKSALQHPWFDELPHAEDPTFIGTWPSRSDGRQPVKNDE